MTRYLAYTDASAAAANLEDRLEVPGEGRTVTDLPTYLVNNREFNVADFAINGVQDRAAAQAAIDACYAAGGGQVVWRGTLTLSTTYLDIKDDVWLRGLGREHSRIIQSTTTVDAVRLTGQRSRLSDCAISYSSAAASGTYATQIRDAGRCRIDDVVWGSNCARFLGIIATSGSAAENNVRNHVRRCSAAAIASEYGVVMAGGSASRRVVDAHLDAVWVSAVGDAFRVEDFVQGARLVAPIADFSGRGYHITPSASGRTFDVFLLHPIADAITTSENIRAVNCYSVYIEYPWLGAVPAGVYGIYLDSTVTRSFVNGGRISHKESGGAALGCVFVGGQTTQVRNVSFLQGAVVPTNAAVVLGPSSQYCAVIGNNFEGFAAGTKDVSNGGSNNAIGPNTNDGYGAEARFGSRVRASEVAIGTTGSAIVKHLTVTSPYDPPNLVAGASDRLDMTVTGAALGDTVVPSFSLDLQDIRLFAAVKDANTVRIEFHNPTAGAINLGSGTLRVDVWGH